MALNRVTAREALVRLREFDTVIDARSESEFAEDHLPDAVNWPSLNDAQRHAVGTEYKRVGAFAAKKRGAAWVAGNIAVHIGSEVIDKPKQWRPLVYCWRGGHRSGALALTLDQIGFEVSLLEGGYREYRRAVIAALEELPRGLRLRVVCGTTGSGKSRLLQRLAREGEQVLDLEALANHRGSVLGLAPGQVQPAQKLFETRIWDALRRFDPGRPIWVESESKKVGDLQVPQGLIQQMRAAPCVWLELALESRVRLLLEDYQHFVDDTDVLCRRLDALRVLRGNDQVNAWQESARDGSVASVVRDLLVRHYDPNYLQSMRRNFALFDTPSLQLTWDGTETGLRDASQRLRAIAAIA
jgi:tRNA 2-selenouridine synthase